MKPKLVACILALLVIVIGVTIIWKLIELCQRLFPKPADDPPAPSISNVVQSSSFVLGPAMPMQAAQETPSTPEPQAAPCFVCFDMQFLAGVLVLTNCSLPGLVGADTFFSDLHGYGLDPSPYSDVYGAGTTPADISFQGGTLTVGSGQLVMVVVERSVDLLQWEPVITNQFSLERIVKLTLPAPCNTNSFFRGMVR